MKKLERQHKVFQFDKRDRPVMQVDPGEVIVVETTDSFDGQFDLSQPRTMDVGTSGENTTLDLKRVLPMTGPIHVRGAEPGDVLVSQILGIVATSNAFSGVLPGFSRLLLGEEVSEQEHWTIRTYELKRGKIQFTEHLQLPYDFMIGSLGVAPAGDPAQTATPGEYGGNHDCIHFDEGSKLYLQVQVPGALASLGDVHASMGDGEGAGTAVECNAEVTLRFQLYKNKRIPGPVLETGTDWMVFGWGQETDEAISVAKNHTIELLMKQLDIDCGEAYMLMAAIGHIRLNELVNPNRSARVEIPKFVVDPLLGDVLGETMAEAEAVLQR